MFTKIISTRSKIMLLSLSLLGAAMPAQAMMRAVARRMIPARIRFIASKAAAPSDRARAQDQHNPTSLEKMAAKIDLERDQMYENISEKSSYGEIVRYWDMKDIAEVLRCEAQNLQVSGSAFTSLSVNRLEKLASELQLELEMIKQKKPDDLSAIDSEKYHDLRIQILGIRSHLLAKNRYTNRVR